MRVRGTTSALLAALVLIGTSACTFMTPQDTPKMGATSDGIDATVGEIDVRNAILVTDDSENASFLVNLVNNSDSAISVKVQYEDASHTKVDQSVFVNPDGVTSYGAKGAKQLVFRNIDAAAGTQFPVFVQYENTAGHELQVPVLDEATDYLSGLVPTASPSDRN